MVALTDLARWTPVALHLDPPAIDWCDMRGERFAEPFLDQTVARLAAAGRDLVRTDLDALLTLDEAPSLEPCGIVLHLSRCGSTLVSRLLGTVPGTLVVAEPAPLNTLLQADPERVDPAVQIRVLRLLVRALGRIRFGDERRFVLKLSSWNVRRLDVIRAAFPNVPLVWVQRMPEPVLASLLAEPPRWLALHERPHLADRLFGIKPDELAGLDGAALAARVLGSLLEAARGSGALAVDHRELPAAIWSRVVPHFSIPLADEDIARMLQESQFHAKDPRRARFDPAADRRPIPPEIRAAAATLGPLYETFLAG
jgi:hypothetical protein